MTSVWDSVNAEVMKAQRDGSIHAADTATDNIVATLRLDPDEEVAP